MGEGPKMKRVSVSWMEELNRRHEAQTANRYRLTVSREADDESKLRSLDSTLKKTTAFMKRLKNIGAGAGPALIEEMEKLNLSKFNEEMAQGIAEARFKISDVPFVVDLCVTIACRYVRFPELLLNELKKNLPLKKSDKVSNPSKLRVDLRLICELLLNGVFGKEGLQAFGAAVQHVLLTDKTEHVHVGLMAGLASQVGWEMAELIPLTTPAEASIEVPLHDLPKSEVLTVEHRRTVRNIFNEYTKSLVERTTNACVAMNKVQKKVKRQERSRGDAAQEDKARLDEAKTLYEKLKQLSCDLCPVVGEQVPDWNEEPSEDEEDELAARELSKALDEGELQLWEDEDTEAFYERLLDLRRVLPSHLHKNSEGDESAEDEEAVLAEAIDDVDMDDLEADHHESQNRHERKSERERTVSEEEMPEIQEIQVNDRGEALVMRSLIETFIAGLENLVNRDAVDEAAKDFVINLNTQINRRKLVRAIMNCVKQRMDLLPFLGRLVATLKPAMPDLVSDVTQQTIKQFRAYATGTEDGFLDHKVKNVTFVAELVKFGIIPRAEALNCLRMLVYDFSGPAIDQTCSMLETCGMYLYRTADSHPKMRILLDVIEKKKSRIKNSRHETLVENALHTVRPTESQRAPLRPPMHEFVRYLVVNMREDTVDDYLRCLRRINWLDEELCDFTVQCLSSPWLLAYSNLQHLASALSGLAFIKYHEWTATEVVDNLIETIRLALESHNDALNQKAMSCVAYLGELYNYSIINSGVVFKVLYQLISFPELPEEWDDFTRIRMVCELLRVISEFFRSGQGKLKMNDFLTFFMKYYWMKRTQWLANALETEAEDEPIFPPELEGQVEEQYKVLRGSLKEMPKSLDHAERLVHVLEESYKARVEGILAGVQSEDTVADEEIEEGSRRVRSLHQIAEEDEDSQASASEMARPEHMDMETEEEEEVHVNMQQPKIFPEDEEFMKDLDRMMLESMKGPSTSSAPHGNITAPQKAREQSKKLAFADEATFKKARPDDEELKPVLLTRGKNRKIALKSVNLGEEGLEKQWRAQMEKERREREMLKRITLQHSERIAQEEEFGEFPPL